MTTTKAHSRLVSAQKSGSAAPETSAQARTQRGEASEGEHMVRDALRVQGLTASYGAAPVLKDVTFAIPTGSMTAVVGPNGAGKSTLLKAVLRLLPSRGTVEVLGSEVSRVRRRIAYVPQRGDVDWTFPITVAGTALLGTYPGLGLFRRPRKADRQRAFEALEQVGMAELANRPIGELSGGQQQRVFLARALAQQADVILLDEPFVGVDATSEALIVEILRGLREQGTTIVVVHHDLATAPEYFTHALLLNRTAITFGPTAEVLTTELLAQTYQILPQ